MLLTFLLLGLPPFFWLPDIVSLYRVFVSETYWFSIFLIPSIRQRGVFTTVKLNLHQSTATILKTDLSEFDTWTTFVVKLASLQKPDCELRLTWHSKACWCVISLYLFINRVFSRAPVTIQALSTLILCRLSLYFPFKVFSLLLSSSNKHSAFR